MIYILFNIFLGVGIYFSFINIENLIYKKPIPRIDVWAMSLSISAAITYYFLGI